MGLSIFIVAAEASADIAGATLIKKLKESVKELTLFGIGGCALQKENMLWRIPSERLNVFGTVEWFNKVFEVFNTYREVIKKLEKNKPNLAILIDAPDFNLRLAKKLHSMKIPVIYYIPPQVWVWRKYRVNIIKKFINLVIVVFPFEKEFFLERGINASFVGHPAVERIEMKKAFRSSDEISSRPRIAIFPGSRPSEVDYHVPIIRNLVLTLRKDIPTVEFMVAVASTINTQILSNKFDIKGVLQFSTNSYEVMKWADLGLVASGTATLEMALSGVPFCAFYRVSGFSWWIFKKIIKYSGFLVLPNIILKEEVVKEFFQEKANEKNLSSELKRLIYDSSYREKMISSFKKVRDSLDSSRAPTSAKDEIINFLRNTNYDFT